MPKAYDIISNEVQLFLDKARDTKYITETDLKDFTLAMGSTSIPIKFEILRETRQVNPDPATGNTATYTSWVPIDHVAPNPNPNNIYSKLDTGDIIIIRVSQNGDSFYQSFAIKALGMYVPKIEFTLSRMVR
jgi:hypothetical protein